jgi:hypothetical protein
MLARMSMRLFTDHAGWEDARKAARWTSASLCASEEHARLARPLQYLLEKWSAIDVQRREVDDALVEADAVVHAVDRELDRLVTSFAATIERELDGGRTNATFLRFFPGDVDDIVRLGLEHEIERTDGFGTIARETPLSDEARANVRAIGDVVAQGKKALTTREKAAGEAARVALRIETWTESAKRARKNVEELLSAYAVAKDLPDAWVKSFFATSRKDDAK